MSQIRQTRLSFAPWADPRTRRLPGVVPVGMADWLEVDDAYAGQMALRDDLIARHPGRVLALDETARPAAEELFDLVLAHLPAGFTQGATIRRPDGLSVTPDRARPLETLGRLVQEDLCLMREGPQGHVLVGAVLCFPAGWTLTEKFGRAMMGIHRPVAKYTEDIGARVQRLMDGVQPGRPLMRGTAHHSNAALHNPRTEAMGHTPGGDLPFIRVERQVLLRLPVTRLVCFSIHTYVVAPEALSPEQAAALAEFPIRQAA
ncbi:heme-dependent oxidative N-demethylase family protein [Paenirhodobacter sp.]|uniref:heme-dependent oxidative N-demethylase family protein n=1 Tax=Paenirhodobacter sp. TaxID=1965326 RepID=UPI003B3C18EA